MRNPTFTAFALLLVFAVSWSSLLMYNQVTVGQLGTVTEEYLEEGEIRVGKKLLPPVPAAHVAQGRKVYQSLGCASCHTQQVRMRGLGRDEERGWGRVSVPRDYIYDEQVLLGNRRVGQDLRNVGARYTDANWLHKHIYKPQSVVKKSHMPNYPFLYEVRKILGQPSENALIFGVPEHAFIFSIPEYTPDNEYEIVPTDRAEHLVAYLLSLRLNYDLPEVPLQYLTDDK